METLVGTPPANMSSDAALAQDPDLAVRDPAHTICYTNTIILVNFQFYPADSTHWVPIMGMVTPPAFGEMDSVQNQNFHHVWFRNPLTAQQLFVVGYVCFYQW